MNRRYTDEQIAEAVKVSKSISETARHLGIGRSGSSWSHLAKRIEKAGLDTSHFLGRRANSGLKHKGGNRRRTPKELLRVFGGEESVPQAGLLRRALCEVGRPFQCEGCGLGPEWEGQPLVLTVDHKNGKRRDCRATNLRFLCPNCHSQTANFGTRKGMKGPRRRARSGCRNGLQFIQMISQG